MNQIERLKSKISLSLSVRSIYLSSLSVVVIALHELLSCLLIHHLLLAPSHSLSARSHLAHNETSRVLVRSLGLAHHVTWLASAHNVLLLLHTWLHHSSHAHNGLPHSCSRLLLSAHTWLSHWLSHRGSHTLRLAHHSCRYLLAHH